MKIDKGLLAAILAPVFIAASVVFVNQIGHEQNPFVIAGYSQFISTLILLPIFLIKGENLSFKKIITEFRNPLIKVILTRALLGNVLLTVGFLLTTGVKSILILRLEPVFVFLWSMLLLKEKPTLLKFSLISFLILGSVLVILPGQSFGSFSYGDLAIMGGLLFLSYSYIPASKVSKEANPFGLAILVNSIGGFIILLCSFLIFPVESFILPLRSVVMMLGSIITFYVIGLPLSFYAFKTIKPWIVSAFSSLEPLAGLLIVLGLVEETILPLQIVGALILLVSTYFLTKRK